jgi:ribosomal protein L9
VPKHEGDLYALRYAEFVVPLVKAVQEQQQIIRAQEQQNQELQKQLQELQQQLQQIKVKLGMDTIITKNEQR